MTIQLNYYTCRMHIFVLETELKCKISLIRDSGDPFHVNLNVTHCNTEFMIFTDFIERNGWNIRGKKSCFGNNYDTKSQNCHKVLIMTKNIKIKT